MFSRFDTITACDRRVAPVTFALRRLINTLTFLLTDRRTDVQSVHVKLEITLQQRTDLNLDGLNKNRSELCAGMLRQGILNTHNDFV